MPGWDAVSIVNNPVFGAWVVLCLSLPRFNSWRDSSHVERSPWLGRSEHAGGMCLRLKKKPRRGWKCVPTSVPVTAASRVYLTVSCEFAVGYLYLIDMCVYFWLNRKWKPFSCKNAQLSWGLSSHIWREPQNLPHEVDYWSEAVQH